MALKIAVVGGDGVGPEVLAESLKVLKAVARMENVRYSTADFDLGGERYLKSGQVLDEGEIDELRKFDAIMLGAVGHPQVKPGILEKGILLRLRFELDQYINLRPVKLYPGVEGPLKNKGPAEINFDVVRENTEDLYCGNGGIMRKGTAQEVATQEMLATRFGVERCLRFAFDLCRQKKQDGRGRGELTLVHKTNVLTHCGDTWFRAFNEIGDADYKDITRGYHHVDACCMYMAATPERYDTVVTANMFGDIITDLGAAIAGGMGVAASGNLNPAGGTSTFEPVHGSAPDIAGQKKANPIAAILSLAMLLSEVGRIKGDAAAVRAGGRVHDAVVSICPKFAGQRMDRLNMATDQVGDLVVAALG